MMPVPANELWNFYGFALRDEPVFGVAISSDESRLYEGSFNNGFAHGYGRVITQPGGSVREGTWCKGRLNGVTSRTF